MVQSGRIEITTGGWVMTDEANAHYYSMIDQLIEGHQWVKTNLGVSPKVGWSIDPFGHGSTVPYLLAASGFDGTIIQRIHYAWKQWFANKQSGDFLWSPAWKKSTANNEKFSMLTHNMPFDIYSIKHSCGPHPFVCLNFDFRKIPGEYTEFSIKAQFITDENVEAKADLLMEQYSRTASLFPHNVGLIPIGDDFRYNKDKEFEQQYVNYKKLIDYINKNKQRYKTEISFGTPKNYFQAIKERTLRSNRKFPTLKGDFFVYADIFTEGRPAYWSGYFTTRPYYKILARELEHNLRSLEILFTLAFNKARSSQHHLESFYKIYEKNYEKVILARRNLGLFQHHDAITGTSKANVMRDYGIRLFESIQDSVKMQEKTIEILLQKDSKNANGFIISELERDNFARLPRKTPINLNNDNKKLFEFVIYNSLAQDSLQVILVRTLTPKVKILDPHGIEIEFQINPVWNITEQTETLDRHIIVSDKEYEIMFVSKLPALSLTVFSVVYNDQLDKTKLSTIYCNDCKDEKSTTTVFDIRGKQSGDIQLENFKMRLLFDEQSGFLKSITKKSMAGKAIQCAIKFAAYKSAQFHSGAYLFKTDTDARSSEKNVLEQYENDLRILITSGLIASEVTAVYGKFLAHTIRIYNTKTHLDNAIYIENDIDFEMPPRNRETEFYMRFQTDIENSQLTGQPEFYSDQNGFQYQRRVKVPSIGIEGNYFPITTAAFIQDQRLRLTLLTTHAQGAASYEPGQLEVLLDRRELYDDYRGLGEGIVDSRLTRHKFWLTLENIENSNNININRNDIDGSQSQEKFNNNKININYQLPSIFVNQLIHSLKYPANLYFIENYDDDNNKLSLYKTKSLLKNNIKFPCDLHLLTLRTLTDNNLPLFPSRSSLMILHRQGYDCSIGGAELINYYCSNITITNGLNNHLFNDVNIAQIESTTLTGLKSYGIVRNLTNIYIEPMDLHTFNLTFH